MIKIDKRVYINIPSDFKLVLKNIITEDSLPIDLSSTGMLFKFYDKIGNVYEAKHDPFGASSENIIYDAEENSLTIKFENYNLTAGQLSSQVATITQDADFDDELWDFYNSKEQINIILV